MFWTGFGKQAQRVFAYRNVQKGKDRHVYSIRVKGKVQSHTDNLGLTDPEFKVSDAGRERVRREGQKNVHAGIKGTEALLDYAAYDWRPITYDPKKHKGFIDRETGKSITKADAAWLTPTGALAGHKKTAGASMSTFWDGFEKQAGLESGLRKMRGVASSISRILKKPTLTHSLDPRSANVVHQATEHISKALKETPITHKIDDASIKKLQKSIEDSATKLRKIDATKLVIPSVVLGTGLAAGQGAGQYLAKRTVGQLPANSPQGEQVKQASSFLGGTGIKHSLNPQQLRQLQSIRVKVEHGLKPEQLKMMNKMVAGAKKTLGSIGPGDILKGLATATGLTALGGFSAAVGAGLGKKLTDGGRSNT